MFKATGKDPIERGMKEQKHQYIKILEKAGGRIK